MVDENCKEEPRRRKVDRFAITNQGYAIMRVDVTDIVRAMGMAEMFRDACKAWFNQYKYAQMKAAEKYKVEKAKADTKEFINKKMK